MPFRPLVCALAAMTLLASLASNGAAQLFVTTGKDTLRSLPGIEIIVESVQPELEAAGLTAASLRADVDQRLRAKGIVTFTSQGKNTSAAKPYLFIDLNALDISGQDLYAIAVQVQVRQTVQSLVTSSNIVDAVTWDSHTVVGVPAKELHTVREEIGEHIDRFIRDWAAVH